MVVTRPSPSPPVLSDTERGRKDAKGGFRAAHGMEKTKEKEGEKEMGDVEKMGEEKKENGEREEKVWREGRRRLTWYARTVSICSISSLNVVAL